MKERRPHKARRAVLLATAVLCFAVAGICGYLVLDKYLTDMRDDAAFAQLAGKSDGAVERVRGLHAQNPDCVGWVKIKDTKIDYPVMYTPNDPEYYLHRNFDKEWSQSGTPFVGAGGGLDGNSFIVYGHHMGYGTMFAQLLKFDDEQFGASHAIKLTTLDETRTYKVFAAFYEDLSGGDYYRYWDEVGQLDEERFDAHVDRLVSKSLYDTGVRPAYGERIVMLSTCSYGTSEQRFCVCGVQR